MTDADEGTADVQWFKVEPEIGTHRKTRLIPREPMMISQRVGAMGVWLLAAAWTAREETNGFVPAEVFEHWDPDGTLTQSLVDCHGAEECGYLEPAVVGGERGYILHDWLEIQPSKEELDAKRDYNAKRQREYRDRRKTSGHPVPPGDGPGGATPDDVPDGVTGGVAPSVTVRQTRDSAVTNAVSSGALDLDLDLTTPPTPPGGRRRSAPDDDPPGFVEFWAAYPRKVGKPSGRKAYARALKRVPGPAFLVEAAKRYASQRAGEDQRYTAHPATWLNDDRWADTPPQLRPAAGMTRGGLVQSRDGAYVERNW